MSEVPSFSDLVWSAVQNNMEELNLNNNKIASIPLTIATLTALTVLTLSPTTQAPKPYNISP